MSRASPANRAELCCENLSSTQKYNFKQLYAPPTVKLSQFCFEIFWVSVVAVIRTSVKVKCNAQNDFISYDKYL